jgi:hypothetical protein
LSYADVVVEHETELHIPRFVAFFLGSDVGSELGPVRSLRLIDAELMPIFKAVLVASGGHPAVINLITEGKPWAEGYRRGIVPQAPFNGSSAFRRIPKEGRPSMMTLYTSSDTLWKVCTERGINERQDFHGMWVFSEQPVEGGLEATRLQYTYCTNSNTLEYRYDAESERYLRWDNGEPLIDALNGEQIAPANVLVLYANHVDTDVAVDVDDPKHPLYAVSIQLWGSGPAKLLRDGLVYDAQWVRLHPQEANDSLLIVDDEGQQIPFKPGKTWIEVVRLEARVEIQRETPEQDARDGQHSTAQVAPSCPPARQVGPCWSR